MPMYRLYIGSHLQRYLYCLNLFTLRIFLHIIPLHYLFSIQNPAHLTHPFSTPLDENVESLSGQKISTTQTGNCMHFLPPCEHRRWASKVWCLWVLIQTFWNPKPRDGWYCSFPPSPIAISDTKPSLWKQDKYVLSRKCFVPFLPTTHRCNL